MHNTKQKLASAFFIFLNGILIGQTNIQVNELLQKTFTAIDQVPQHQAISFLKNSPQELPLIEKLEFRTETDEWDWQAQEYIFRTSFNGRKAKSVQRKLTNHQLKIYELQQAEAGEKLLSKRYTLINDWYFLAKKIDLLEQQREVFDDKKKTYQELMQKSQTFNMDGFLKNEESIHALNRERKLLETESKWLILSLIPDANHTNYSLTTNQWITVKQMEKILKENGADIFGNSRYILQNQKIELSKSELELEKAETKKILDFAQIKYRNNDKLNFGQEWSIGVSFNIPTRSTNRVKQNKAILEVLEEDYKQRLLTENLKEKIKEQYFLFERQRDTYELLKKQIDDNQTETMLANNLNHPNINILTLLKAKENTINNKKELIKIEYSLYSIYLNILKLSGKFAQTPKVNFLSETFEPIKK